MNSRGTPGDEMRAIPASFLSVALIAAACKGGAANKGAGGIDAGGSDATLMGRVVVPGTGVSLEPPPGTRLTALGPSLIDAAGEVLVAVAVGLGDRAPDLENPDWQTLYPEPPTFIRIGPHQGRLWNRRRDRDGGGYDAWVMWVVSGARGLVVMMTDKGRDGHRFERLRASMQTVLWEPDVIDAEIAFGASAGAVPGMRLERQAAGLLMYRSQDPQQPDATVSFSFVPFDLPSTPDACSSLVRSQAIRMGQVFGPVQVVDAGVLHGCEVDETLPNGKSLYTAAVAWPHGGAVIATGVVPTPSFPAWRPRFSDALRELRAIR